MTAKSRQKRGAAPRGEIALAERAKIHAVRAARFFLSTQDADLEVDSVDFHFSLNSSRNRTESPFVNFVAHPPQKAANKL